MPYTDIETYLKGIMGNDPRIVGKMTPPADWSPGQYDASGQYITPSAPKTAEVPPVTPINDALTYTRTPLTGQINAQPQNAKGTTGGVWGADLGTYQKELFNKYTSTPFQYGNWANSNPNTALGKSMNNAQESLAGYNPSFSWSPEQIKSTYSGTFSDLRRQQQLGLQDLLGQLKERGLGRSGANEPSPETPVGRMLSEYGRQESNIIENVLGQLLPKEQELKQSGAANLSNILNNLMQGQLGAEGATMNRLGAGQGLLGDVANQMLSAQGLNANEVSTNKSLALQERTTKINELNSSVQRTSQALQDAIAEGNYRLANVQAQQLMDLNSQKMNLEAQGQAFGQESTKVNQAMNAVDLIAKYANLDEQTKNQLMAIISNLANAA